MVWINLAIQKDAGHFGLSGSCRPHCPRLLLHNLDLLVRQAVQPIDDLVD
jgi:hypothetical protein